MHDNVCVAFHSHFLLSATFCSQIVPLLPSNATMAEFQALRYDDDEAWARTAQIEAHGQPVRLSVEWLGSLLVVSTFPEAGFVHLVQNPDECVAAYGPYHVSAAHWPIADEADYDALHAALDGQWVVLPIRKVRGEGCMNLGDCELADLVMPIHERPGAAYAGRDLHISG